MDFDTQTPPLILLAKWHARVPMAKNEIAACMGIDRKTVTQIERSAMQKIRAELVRVMQLNSKDNNENESHQPSHAAGPRATRFTRAKADNQSTKAAKEAQSPQDPDAHGLRNL